MCEVMTATGPRGTNHCGVGDEYLDVLRQGDDLKYLRMCLAEVGANTAAVVHTESGDPAIIVEGPAGINDWGVAERAFATVAKLMPAT